MKLVSAPLISATVSAILVIVLPHHAVDASTNSSTLQFHPANVGQQLNSMVQAVTNAIKESPPSMRPLVPPNFHDRFSYYETNLEENIFGPADWGQVHCSNVEDCPGWPTNWEDFNSFIPYEGTENMCRDCSNSTRGVCQRHKQSPINLERSVTATRQCHDRHRMNFVKGNCRFRDVRFEILPHVLRAYQPAFCGVTPNIDFSMGFPRPWHLEFIDISVPSQHMIEGTQYDAEIVLSHTYSVNKDDRLIGNVAVLLERGDDEDHYPFLELYIRSWEGQARKIRRACRKQDFSALNKPQKLSKMATLPPESAQLIPTQVLNTSYFQGEFQPYDFYQKAETEYYYRYEGSLPEPPCFETVHWRVIKNPVRVSPDQMNRLEKLFYNRVNPETCQKETAGKPRSPGAMEVDVNRPIQTASFGHKLVFCECEDWRSAFSSDREWCTNTMEDRGVFVFQDPSLPDNLSNAPSDAPSSTPSSSPSN